MKTLLTLVLLTISTLVNADIYQVTATVDDNVNPPTTQIYGFVDIEERPEGVVISRLPYRPNTNIVVKWSVMFGDTGYVETLIDSDVNEGWLVNFNGNTFNAERDYCFPEAKCLPVGQVTFEGVRVW